MVLTDKLKRSVTLTLAALLFLASLVPLLTLQTADAYALLGPRAIKMSDSAGAATNVTYEVSFDVTTAGNVGGIVVTFCQGSPIIGDTTCVVPAGFDLNGSGIANLSSGAGNVDLTGFTGATSDLDSSGATTHNTLILTNGTPDATAASDTATFEITGVDNPTASNTTFYARIYTYDTNTEATGYTLANPDVAGASIDAGGIALSTANQITITSKVQERLTFCVYTTATFTTTTDNNCTAKSGSTVSLGDTNGVLDSAGEFVDKSAYYSVTTNAAGEAAIRMKGDTLELTPACAAASCRIEAIGGTAAVTTAGTEQFGVCNYQRDGAGLVTSAPYTGGAGTECSSTTQSAGTGSFGGAGSATFAFDTTVANTTYGQQIASKPAGAFSTGNLVFIGNISDTTEPGIYTTTLTFVATGTY